jgi:hypothetical protein
MAAQSSCSLRQGWNDARLNLFRTLADEVRYDVALCPTYEAFATKAGQTPSPKASLDLILGHGISGTGILALDEYVNVVIEFFCKKEIIRVII